MRSTGCRRGSTRRSFSPPPAAVTSASTAGARRHWYPALDAAGIEQRGPYQLRHTFATEALAARISIFELARVMGTSVKMIDRTYGHLARDSEASIIAEARREGGSVTTPLRRRYVRTSAPSDSAWRFGPGARNPNRDAGSGALRRPPSSMRRFASSRPVTPEAAGSSPVAPVPRSAA